MWETYVGNDSSDYYMEYLDNTLVNLID